VKAKEAYDKAIKAGIESLRVFTPPQPPPGPPAIVVKNGPGPTLFIVGIVAAFALVIGAAIWGQCEVAKEARRSQRAAELSALDQDIVGDSKIYLDGDAMNFGRLQMSGGEGAFPHIKWQALTVIRSPSDGEMQVRPADDQGDLEVMK
jgi:hypothetical protein